MLFWLNVLQQALVDNERRRKLEHGLLEPDVQPVKKKDKKITQVIIKNLVKLTSSSVFTLKIRLM